MPTAYSRAKAPRTHANGKTSLDLTDAPPNSLFCLSSSLARIKGSVEELAAIHDSSRHIRAGSYQAFRLAYDTLVPIKAGHLAAEPRADLDGVFLEAGVKRRAGEALREQFVPI
jgi:hypothetical protein